MYQEGEARGTSLRLQRPGASRNPPDQTWSFVGRFDVRIFSKMAGIEFLVLV